MNSFFHKPIRRRAMALFVVIAVMAMVGMVGALLSTHFITLYRHVRMQADEAQARQLTASALQWAAQNRQQIVASRKPTVQLPVPRGVSAAITITRAEDGAACSIEVVVQRASHKTAYRRSHSLKPSP